MSADFLSFAAAVPPSLRKGLAPVLANETEYNGNVYLEYDVDELFELAGEVLGEDVAMTPNFPVFVAIDRFGANRDLLDGHAGRWVANADLPKFAALWAGIKARPKLIARSAEAIDRGQDAGAEIAAGIALLDAAIADATEQGLDLVVLCLCA